MMRTILRTVQIYDDGDMICGLGTIERADQPSDSETPRHTPRTRNIHRIRQPSRIMRVTPSHNRHSAEEKELARV